MSQQCYKSLSWATWFVMSVCWCVPYVCRSRGRCAPAGGLGRIRPCISDTGALQCCADSHTRHRCAGQTRSTPSNRNGSSERVRYTYTLVWRGRTSTHQPQGRKVKVKLRVVFMSEVSARESQMTLLGPFRDEILILILVLTHFLYGYFNPRRPFSVGILLY